MVDEDGLYCPHTVTFLPSLHGAVRQYPDGPHAYLAFRDAYGEDVAVGCDDIAAFVAALRRSADEIEAGRTELPPVTETGEQFTARHQAKV